jgi:hypothetical protein
MKKTQTKTKKSNKKESEEITINLDNKTLERLNKISENSGVDLNSVIVVLICASFIK